MQLILSETRKKEARRIEGFLLSLGTIQTAQEFRVRPLSRI